MQVKVKLMRQSMTTQRQLNLTARITGPITTGDLLISRSANLLKQWQIFVKRKNCLLPSKFYNV